MRFTSPSTNTDTKKKWYDNTLYAIPNINSLNINRDYKIKLRQVKTHTVVIDNHN